MGVSFKISIQAPPERVFDVLADVAHHPDWANPKSEMKMEQTAGSGPGAGATYHSQGVFLKKPVSADISVTAYERPSRITLRVDEHREGKETRWFDNAYTLRAVSGGTQVTKRLSTGTAPAMLYLAYPALRADAMPALRALKAKAES